MAQVAAYHRPDNLDQAIELLAQPGRTPLAGGTVLNADREPPAIEVVDLQALGLGELSSSTDGGTGDRLHLGAMVTLDRLADHEATPPWLADLARAELPSTLRTAATVGGTIAAGGADSVLLAGLLAARAVLEQVSPGARTPAAVPADEALAGGIERAGLIKAVTIDAGSRGVVAVTGRTPADVPIVAAVAARGSDGGLRLALTGVAATPVLVEPDDPVAGLDPPGDFRGSTEYRRHLAAVLSARAIAELGERA